MWVKDGLAWVDLQTQLPPTHTHTHTHTPSSVWKGESRGGRVSGRTLLWVTPECLCSDVYFLCVVCTVFVCQAEAVFPSSPASAVLTVKQSLDDGWALCINSLSEPMTTQLKIDHAYITQQNTPTHTHTFTLCIVFTLACSYTHHTLTVMHYSNLLTHTVFLLPPSLLHSLWESPFCSSVLLSFLETFLTSDSHFPSRHSEKVDLF